jgi:hypothetical protein
MRVAPCFQRSDDSYAGPGLPPAWAVGQSKGQPWSTLASARKETARGLNSPDHTAVTRMNQPVKIGSAVSSRRNSNPHTSQVADRSASRNRTCVPPLSSDGQASSEMPIGTIIKERSCVEVFGSESSP